MLNVGNDRSATIMTRAVIDRTERVAEERQIGRIEVSETMKKLKLG